MANATDQVAAHYARSDIGETILQAMRAAGKDIERLTPDDLAEVDHFHGRRLEATEELARLLAPQAETHVLDVGCGIGGPARYLAYHYRCRVTGLDLTPEFIAAAEFLTARTGLTDRVSFRQGNATAMPFADASFDALWTQNAVMNIADRPRLYAEMARVLKPGGRLAMQDVAQGPAGPPFFPVPWARDPAISFLHTPEDTRAMLEAAGFRVLVWLDNSAAAIAQAAAERAKAGGAPVASSPGLQLIAGEDFPERARNTARSLREGRTLLINGLLERV